MKLAMSCGRALPVIPYLYVKAIFDQIKITQPKKSSKNTNYFAFKVQIGSQIQGGFGAVHGQLYVWEVEL